MLPQDENNIQRIRDDFDQHWTMHDEIMRDGNEDDIEAYIDYLIRKSCQDVIKA